MAESAREKQGPVAVGPQKIPKPGGVQSGTMPANDEDYDPYEHRPQENLNSDAAVFINLLKSTIGSGILFLPYAFKETGSVSGTVCSVLIAMLSTYTAVTTVKCSQILCKRARVPSLDFGQVAQSSFEYGPEKLRKYSHGFKNLTNFMACFAQYQTLVLYILYVASSFKQVVEYFCTINWDVRVYVVISAPFYCLISLVPNLKYLTPFSVLGSIFLTSGFFVTVYYFFIDLKSPGRLAMYTNMLAIPVFCTKFIFALHNMCILMPLENSMKTPAHLPMVLMISMSFAAIVYLFFGFFGFNKYEDACDTVIKNLPLDQVASQIVKISIAFSVMFSYGIHHIIPVSIIWPMLAEKTTENRHRLYERIFRVGGAILTVLMAIAVPELGPLLGLFAALCFNSLTLLLPGLIDLATKWENSKNPKTLLIKNICIFILWIFLLAIGCFESMKKIVNSYGTAKPQDSNC